MKAVKMRWDLLAKALTFYASNGWPEMQLPWYASKIAMSMTCPTTKCYHATMDGLLVGSAEQSFVDLMLASPTPITGCALTPCFRDDIVDELHVRQFMKVELFTGGHVGRLDCEDERLKVTVNAARTFFESIGTENLEVVATISGYDIESNGVEIGSYGIRQLDGYIWIYGTGFADPRWSMAQKRYD